MPFRNRNAYYLRISAKNVLPLYLYLDERHIDWMTDRVLQHVLADLRPLIAPKLQAEANILFGAGGSSSTKQGTVDVHRGDTYQFAFFFRKTEPHSVLIKTRTFIATPREPQKAIPPPLAKQPPTKKRTGKRKPLTPSESAESRKKRKTKGKAKARDEEVDIDLAMTSEEEGGDGENDYGGGVNDQVTSDAPRQSGRFRKVVAGGYREDEEDDETPMDVDAEMINDSDGNEAAILMGSTSASANGGSGAILIKDEDDDVRLTSEPPPGANTPAESVHIDTPPPPPPDIELEIGEQESKLKPTLQLQYQGFSIYGHCLCVIVEPWPPVRSQTRAPSVAPGPSNPRAPSIAPPDFVPSGGRLREKTPLFLPDFTRERSETPAPFLQQRVLPPVPLFDDEPHNSDGSDSELIQFSQALNSAGEFRAGAEDDDEMDGAVFFGDADEEVRAL